MRTLKIAFIGLNLFAMLVMVARGNIVGEVMYGTLTILWTVVFYGQK